MTASFILNGVTTDPVTLQTGLLELTDLPGVDAETVAIAQRFYAFITTTEANPFHDPRALQREILRQARTNPRALSVFMKALSLQSGWKPNIGNRFAEHVDLSFLKKRSGPAQLSAGAVVPERSGSSVSKISRQNRMQATGKSGNEGTSTSGVDVAVIVTEPGRQLLGEVFPTWDRARAQLQDGEVVMELPNGMFGLYKGRLEEVVAVRLPGFAEGERMVVLRKEGKRIVAEVVTRVGDEIPASEKVTIKD